MNVTEMQAKADALSSSMLAKGLRGPAASVTIKSHEQPSVYLQWRSKREAVFGGDSAFEFLRGDTIEEAFAKAEAWIAARPDPEQAKLNEFLSAVGAAADLGRELGIDAEFVNPLLATMKSLSENALTYQGAAE